MPSQFESDVAVSLDELYDQFGLSATYTAPDGTTASCTIRLHRNPVTPLPGSGRTERGAAEELQTAELLVRQSELAKPVAGGRFTVEGNRGGEVWTLEATPLLKNGQHHGAARRVGVVRMMEQRMKN